MVSVHGCPMVTPGMHAAGGMNVYLRQIAPLLSASGICVDVFTRNHHEGGPEVFDFGPNTRVIHLPAGSPELVKTEVLPYLTDYAAALSAYVKDGGEGYDAVHSHYWLSARAGKRLADELGVPHMFSFHTIARVKERASAEPELQERKEIEAEVAASADLLFAFTEEERSDLTGLFAVPNERVHVVPGGVDLSLFSPRSKQQARQKLGIDLGERVILYVGRIEAFKGPDVLVQALAMMRERANTRLLLVGGSEHEHSADWLHTLARESGVDDRITWHGAVHQAELADYYVAADLCAVPSYHESFGLAALEAMASGTPVVASDVGSLRRLIVNGTTGSLVATHSPQDFAHCLEELLSDPRRRTEMGHAAHERAMLYTWNGVVNLLRQGYETAIARQTARRAVSVCSA
jgi:D-inositol-3-phosphate glycosyltransferase